MNCVQILKQNDIDIGECTHNINYSHDMMRNLDWIMTVKHIYREGEWVVDWLADEWISKDEMFWISENSLVESRILVSDTRGMTSLCSISL